VAGAALNWAEAHALGHTYLYGAAGPGSYDCSGLVMAAYAHATGIRLPHSTYAMLASGHLRQVPIASAPRGALLFFGTGHVEMKTIWPHTSFGAHSSRDPVIGWRQWWPGSYEPTAAYIVVG
jgi:cell wall-associated NlpC family hydrolase